MTCMHALPDTTQVILYVLTNTKITSMYRAPSDFGVTAPMSGLKPHSGYVHGPMIYVSNLKAYPH